MIKGSYKHINILIISTAEKTHLVVVNNEQYLYQYVSVAVTTTRYAQKILS